MDFEHVLDLRVHHGRVRRHHLFRGGTIVPTTRRRSRGLDGHCLCRQCLRELYHEFSLFTTFRHLVSNALRVAGGLVDLCAHFDSLDCDHCLSAHSVCGSERNLCHEGGRIGLGRHLFHAALHFVSLLALA